MNPRPSERANAPSEVAGRFADQLSSARSALRGYARALAAGQGSVDPDDAVQEALTRAWTRRASFDMERPLLPWLKRIALRAFLDLRRRP
ncbi:MAG: sigma factor, partial [Planctomycetota bacterium]|nr:sigma factor [Planctomycetota bacterium]